MRIINNLALFSNLDLISGDIFIGLKSGKMKILLLVLILERFDRKMKKSLSIVFSIACLMGPAALAAIADEKALEIFEHYCFDCHGDGSDKGGLDLSVILGKEDFDGSLIFENLVTGKMPPADKDQPDAKEKRELLEWLAGRQGKHVEKSFRRHRTYEFVHSEND